jgi:glycosyltransferase involved in cell wall biosynthesis
VVHGAEPRIAAAAPGVMSPGHPRVLMVTGAYYPEISGGGLQTRAVIRALRGAAEFEVLTTSTDPSLPARSVEDEVTIRRVFVNMRSRASRLLAPLRIANAFLDAVRRVDLVNLHGFSRKAIPLVVLSRLFRKPFVLTLQTGIHDEPKTVRAIGKLAYWAYANADLYLSVSPGLSRAYLDAGLPAARLRQVSNAVDVDRFAPGGPADRAALRAELGLPAASPIVLFVGFFSRDKRPDVLYTAWSRIAPLVPSALVFVGATRGRYQEIDPDLADTIRTRAGAEALVDRILFVGPTDAIEKYYRAADMYVLPSIREGLPIALLEAMSSALPCVASRLPGSTDTIIEDGVNGLLVAPDDVGGLAAAIRQVLTDSVRAARLGAAARETVMARYAVDRTAQAWLSAYRALASRDDPPPRLAEGA